MLVDFFTLYFAIGLLYIVVNSAAVASDKKLGLNNAQPVRLGWSAAFKRA